MATVINRAVVLPNYYLSLEVARDGSLAETPDSYLVSVGGVETLVALEDGAGYNALHGIDYLPKVATLARGTTVDVFVAPYADGLAIGDASDIVSVTASHDYSPETIIRQMVADAIDAGGVTYGDDSVWVARTRQGFPDTSVRLSGRQGHIVEVGVTYMTADNPWANSTDEDTDIVVPVSVQVKADDPDRGQVAVDIAWKVRQALNENLPAMGYGIASWRWSGGAPEEMSGNMRAVNMQMTVTRVAERGGCD